MKFHSQYGSSKLYRIDIDCGSVGNIRRVQSRRRRLNINFTTPSHYRYCWAKALTRHLFTRDERQAKTKQASTDRIDSSFDWKQIGCDEYYSSKKIYLSLGLHFETKTIFNWDERRYLVFVRAQNNVRCTETGWWNLLIPYEYVAHKNRCCVHSAGLIEYRLNTANIFARHTHFSIIFWNKNARNLIHHQLTTSWKKSIKYKQKIIWNQKVDKSQ